MRCKVVFERSIWKWVHVLDENAVLTLCFLTLGTLEEIILQRQMQKGSLATMAMDRAQKSRKASEGLNADEIRDCFTLKHESCSCDTRAKVGNWPDYGKISSVETLKK